MHIRHVHVLMLCSKFGWIPIIVFSVAVSIMEFDSLHKNGFCDHT